MSSASPRILVIGLGGTIARPSGGLEAASTRRGVAELVRHVPAELARLDLLDLRAVGSSALTLEDVSVLAHTIAEARGRGVDGAVVIQGTDTIEETSWALATMLRPEGPTIVTGAMRLADHPSPDGAGNVLDALRVAISPAAATLGPVVVTSSTIHLARWVHKSATHGLDAFQSPGFGPIGAVVEGRARIWARSTLDDYLGLPELLDIRVDLVTVSLGGNQDLQAHTAGADGIVLAAMGGGHVPPSMVPAIGALIDSGIPVVLASRTGAGPILEATYSGPGSESDLIRLGAVPAGLLSPLKARVRLIVALALGMRAGDVFPA